MRTIREEEEALEAYFKFLTLKGVSQPQLDARGAFLNEVVTRLQSKQQTREMYAETLNALMPRATDAKWLDCVTIAREFYPFWMQDIKAIACLTNSYGADLQTIEWKPLPTSLVVLSESLKQEVFNEQESLLLEQYLNLLHEQALERHAGLVRIKLAKIILLRLRDAPLRNNLVYRMAVDVTLPLFRQKKSRQLFLAVVREFFYLWINAAHD